MWPGPGGARPECRAEELGLLLGNGAESGGLSGVNLSSLFFGPVAVVWRRDLDELCFQRTVPTCICLGYLLSYVYNVIICGSTSLCLI